MKVRVPDGRAEKICLGCGVDYAVLVDIGRMRSPFETGMMNKLRNEWSIGY